MKKRILLLTTGGTIGGGGLVLTPDTLPKIAGPCHLQGNPCEGVFLIKLTPGLIRTLFTQNLYGEISAET